MQTTNPLTAASLRFASGFIYIARPEIRDRDRWKTPANLDIEINALSITAPITMRRYASRTRGKISR